MSDEERRKKERKVKANGATVLEEARAVADHARTGHGLAGYLAKLVGTDTYVEGVRINYRGTLVDVLHGGDGRIAGLLGRWQRISYFEKGGPNAGYTYTHEHECVIPWETVHLIGPEGFAGCKWPKVTT